MKKLVKIAFNLGIASLLAFPTITMAADYPSMTLRFGTGNPPGSIHTIQLDKFKEVIERESGGKIKINTFYGGSLGDEQANVKQLRTSEIHATVVACGNLTPFAPTATFYILPYLYEKRENARAIIFNKEFNDMMADRIAKESAARPLSFAVGGYRHLTNSKRPVTNMNDIKGLKIRVPPVDIQLEAFRSWGVEAHPLAWSETFNGLQQGVVDGQENPSTVNRDQKFWEVQKHITPLHYMLWVGPLLVSEPWYRKLDPQTKALIDKAAIEAAEHTWAWADKSEGEALELCIKHGMVVTNLTDEAKWIEAARGVWPKYYKAIGGKEIVDRALSLINN